MYAVGGVGGGSGGGGGGGGQGSDEYIEQSVYAVFNDGATPASSVNAGHESNAMMMMRIQAIMSLYNQTISSYRMRACG